METNLIRTKLRVSRGPSQPTYLYLAHLSSSSDPEKDNRPTWTHLRERALRVPSSRTKDVINYISRDEWPRDLVAIIP